MLLHPPPVMYPGRTSRRQIPFRRIQQFLQPTDLKSYYYNAFCKVRKVGMKAYGNSKLPSPLNRTLATPCMWFCGVVYSFVNRL